MNPVQESEILAFLGGTCWPQFGTVTRRTTVPRRGGEESPETFSRTGAVGTYGSGIGSVHTAEASTPRAYFGDLDGDGIREAYAVLEASRTNLVVRSEAFDNASWTKVRSSITANNQTAPDGLATGDTLVEDATASATHYVRTGNISVTSSGTISVSAFCRANVRSWVAFLVVETSTSTNLFQGYFDLANGVVGTTSTGGTGTIVGTYMDPHSRPSGATFPWYRCKMVGTVGAFSTVHFWIKLATGDGLDTYTGDGTSGCAVWGGQLEDAGGVSSYIPTAASSVTRNADLLTVPFYATPQAMQVYASRIEDDLSSDGRVVRIGSTGDTDPRFLIQQITNGTVYRAFHDTGSNSVESQATLSPSLGDRVEVLATLNADGSVQMAGRTNGGTTTTASASSALALASAWSDAVLTVNATGLGRNRAVIVTRGTGHTLDEFAALV